jgi:hypothetical protein
MDDEALLVRRRDNTSFITIKVVSLDVTVFNTRLKGESGARKCTKTPTTFFNA